MSSLGSRCRACVESPLPTSSKAGVVAGDRQVLGLLLTFYLDTGWAISHQPDSDGQWTANTAENPKQVCIPNGTSSKDQGHPRHLCITHKTNRTHRVWGMEGEDDATVGLSLGRRSQHHAMGKVSELALGWFGGGGIKLQRQTWFANMAAPRAWQKVQKWVQHYTEQLWFGGCMEEKQWGKWNWYAQRDGTGTCTVHMMRDESHMKFLPPINPKVKTMHVKEQQKQNMFIRDYFSEYKHYRHWSVWSRHMHSTALTSACFKNIFNAWIYPLLPPAYLN